MFDLLLATLLAQTTPGPEMSAAPSATAAASAAPAMPATPAPITFPRGSRRMPMDVPPLAEGDVLIRNSGSTNTAGYAIVVHKNFSADFAGQQKMLGAPQAKWLYAKLDAAKPFTGLGGTHCMKSASFGSITTITYDGETTPDLSCPSGPDSRELMRTIAVIVDQLGISTRRVPGMMRL